MNNKDISNANESHSWWSRALLPIKIIICIVGNNKEKKVPTKLLLT